MKQLLHILSALIFLFLFSTAKAKAPKEYHEAISLAGQANTMLLTGEVKLADSMIRRSIKLYPVTNIFIYVRTLAKLPDLRTANQIMDLAVARVKNFPGKTLYMQSGFTGAVELSEKDYAR